MATLILENLGIGYGEAESLAISAEYRGHKVIWWNDEWLKNGEFPNLKEEFVIFHGSLNVASILKKIDNFKYSSYYDQLGMIMANDDYIMSTVKKFVNNTELYTRESEVFVRPNSPLKEFSGRVVKTQSLSFADFDYGFYYDDVDLPIIISSVKKIQHEVRFLICCGDVVGNSLPNDYNQIEMIRCKDIAKIAARLFMEDIYFVDVGIVNGDPRVIEVNQFSGGQIYNIPPILIISAIEKLEGLNMKQTYIFNNCNSRGIIE